MKRKKLLIIVGGIILLIAIIGGILYWNFKTGPKYSILQVKTALEDHDFALFEKYVDMESVMSSLIDQVLEINKSTSSPKNEWEQLGQDLGTGLVNLLKPQLSSLYKQQIQKWVESGKFETENSTQQNLNYSLNDLWSRSNADKITGIEYIKKEGKIAYIGFGIKQERFDNTLIFNIKMRDKGGYWQVAELMDLVKFQKSIEDFEAARVAKLNEPIINEMYKSLKINDYTKHSFSTDYWGWNKFVKLEVSLQSTSDKTISEYLASINVHDVNFRINKDIFVNTLDNGKNENLLPYYTQTWSSESEINILLDGDNFLYEIPINELDFNITISYIKFDDGTELKLHEKWEQI